MGEAVGKKTFWVVATLLFVFNLTGCQSKGEDAVAQATATQRIGEASPQVATETPQPAPGLVFINRSAEWQTMGLYMTEALDSFARERAWSFQTSFDLTGSDEFVNPFLIVVAGGDNDLGDLIESLSDTFFILVGIDGAVPSGRVAVIGPYGMRPDQVAFINGYISALVTSDWRTGILASSESGPSMAEQIGYRNGVTYFCGLCRVILPPFGDYPASVSMTTPDENGLLAAYEQLTSQAVQTVTVSHQIPASSLDVAFRDPSTANALWIGPEAPAGEFRDRWIATVLPNPMLALPMALTRLEAGDELVSLAMTFDVRDVNSELLPEGKLEHVLQIIRDLEQGIIDTGVDPRTGLER